MKTNILAELRYQYAKKPVTLAAINRAIEENGVYARCIVSKGLASKSPRSNMSKAARAAGFENYFFYIGARAGKMANDGTVNIIVEAKGGD